MASPRMLLQRAELEAARFKPNPRDAQAFRSRGLARLQVGRLRDVVADLRQAAAVDSLRAEVQSELAFVLILGGLFPEALEATSTLALDPENAAAHAYAGHVLLHSGGALPKESAHLERGSQRLPENVDVHFDPQPLLEEGIVAITFLQSRPMTHVWSYGNPHIG